MTTANNKYMYNKLFYITAHFVNCSENYTAADIFWLFLLVPFSMLWIGPISV